MSWHQQHPTGQLLSNANSDVEAAWAPIAPLPMAVGTVAMMVIAVVQMLLHRRRARGRRAAGLPGRDRRQRASTSGWQSPLMTRAQALRAELSEVAHESFDGALVVKTPRPRDRGDRALRRQGAPAARRQRPRRPDPRRRSTRCSRRCPASACSRCWPSACCRVEQRRHRPRQRRHGRLPAHDRVLPDPLDRLAGRRVPAQRRRLRPGAGGARRHRRDGVRRPRRRRRRGRVPGSTCARLAYRYDRRPAAARRPHASPSSPGRTVAVVGATASGKSTLTSLLLRLVDPDDGQVLLDGIDLRDLAPGELAEHVALVPQQAFLFDDTVRGNVTLGADVPDDDGVGGAAHRPGRRLRRGAAATVSTPGSGSAARRCPAASGSGSRWPGRWSAGRGCWSSTTPPRRSTPRSRPGSSPRCATGDGRRRRVVVVAYRKATIALADEVVYLERRPRRRPRHPRRAAGPQPRLRRPGQRLRAGDRRRGGGERP